MDDMLMTINNNVVRLTVTVENLVRRLDEHKVQMEQMSKRIDVLKDETDKRLDLLEKQNGNTAISWLKYIGTAIASILISYVAVKVGLK